MKKIAFIMFLSVAPVSAHDHVEVGRDPENSARLGLDGPGFQLGCYVPVGEFFSGYTPVFPGGWHACELTFTTETNALDSADGANPRIELVSVTGPAGGNFGFWEVGATNPTWFCSTGWNSDQGNIPSFPVVYNGDAHAHGRVFTMDKPGDYTVRFRAVDSNGAYSASADLKIVFLAQVPPPLSIRLSNSQATISFTSRTNLTYELQTRTNLSSGLWQTNGIPTNNINGDGALKEVAVPLSHPRAFFRLIEFK